LLPLLYILECADVNRPLEESVYLGQDADNLNVITERSEVFVAVVSVRSLHALETLSVDWLVPCPKVVSARL